MPSPLIGLPEASLAPSRNGRGNGTRSGKWLVGEYIIKITNLGVDHLGVGNRGIGSRGILHRGIHTAPKFTHSFFQSYMLVIYLTNIVYIDKMV